MATKNVINNDHVTVDKATGKEPRWDLLAYKTGAAGENTVIDWLATADNTFSVEIKTDKRAARTNNVYIELSCAGKLSGILQSEATWVTILIGSTMLTFKRDIFADFIRERVAEADANRGRGSNCWIATTSKDPKYPTRGLVYAIRWLIPDFLAYQAIREN